jgi:hypothetical protein
VDAFPFAGVNVEATGTENMLYCIFFFCSTMESLRLGVDLILKASETVGEYGFTTVTVSVPMLSFSWATTIPQRLKKSNENI